MNVVICDDEQECREDLDRHLRQYCEIHGITCRLHTFESGKELLRQYMGVQPDIIFLDILMKGTDGIETARAIRKMDQHVPLILVTVSRSYSLEGFGVGALHYLLKPVREQELSEAMRRALRSLELSEKRLVTAFRQRINTTRYDDILYAEVMDKACFIHTDGETVKTYCTMEELVHRLDDPRFLRCQRSYLVNLDKVNGIERGCFVMRDGRQIPISRIDRQKIRADYHSYLLQRLGGME